MTLDNDGTLRHQPGDKGMEMSLVEQCECVMSGVESECHNTGIHHYCHYNCNVLVPDQLHILSRVIIRQC